MFTRGGLCTKRDSCPNIEWPFDKLLENGRSEWKPVQGAIFCILPAARIHESVPRIGHRVGAEIYAAAISTDQSRAGLDSRLDLDVPTTSYEVPREIAGRLRGLMAALGLSFATVDLKVDYSSVLQRQYYRE